MGACQCCMKLWVVFMSLAFMLVGTVVMAFSVYLLTEKVDQHVADAGSPNVQYLEYGRIFILVSGCLLLLGGIVGCCGGCRRSSGCLSLFLAIVLIIAVAQIAAGVFAFMRRDELSAHFKDMMLQTFYQHHKQDTQPTQWDYIQTNWQCCGPNSYRDYQNIRSGTIDMTLSSGLSSGYYNVPASCCINEAAGTCQNLKFPADGSIPSGTDIFLEGCSSKLLLYFTDHVHYLMYAMIIVGSAELFCILFSCILIHAFRSDRYSSKY